MVTREQIEEALDSGSKKSYQTKDVDYEVMAVNLLRERIPYKECRSIISGAEHDLLYLCEVHKATPHLIEEDLVILADCNCRIDEDTDCIALFV